MPYEIHWEDRGQYRRFFGHTNDQELKESVHRTSSSPRFDELRYIILDLLDIEQYRISNPAFIEETAAFDSACSLSNPRIRIALVTTDPGIMTLARAYVAHPLAPYPLRICATLDSARDWTSGPGA